MLAMVGWTLLTVWAACLLFQVGLGVAAYWQQINSKSTFRRPLYAAAAASGVSVITLYLFAKVFVIGGASPIAQGNGDDDRSIQLWALWAEAWLPLLVCNFAALIATVAAVALPPWRPLSLLSRIAAILANLCTWYALLRWFPTA